VADLGWKDLITFGTALLGAGLGIINTWAAVNQRRVKLRVRPSHAIAISNGARGVSVDIVNLSSFAVTVQEVGFVPSGARGRLPGRMVVPHPLTSDGKPFARRLEPREAVTVYLDYEDLRGKGRMMGRAYVRTLCDEMVFGGSPALTQLRRDLA
jgi:hypothetical protein